MKAMVWRIRAVVFTLLNLRTHGLVLEERSHKYKMITVQNLTGIILSVISFIWFYYPGEYVLIANGDKTLFLKTFSYLGSFLDRPGGLLDYLGSFLSQFFRFRFTGALVLAGMITSSYYLTGLLLARISGKKELFFLGVITAMLFLGMHNFYPHQVSHSLGFILVLGFVSNVYEDLLCKGVDVVIHDSLEYRFVDNTRIQKMIRSDHPDIAGTPISFLNTEKIEA